MIRCANLEKIEASNNEIASVPHELGRLVKLKTFDLTNNKLNVVPPGILLLLLVLLLLQLLFYLKFILLFFFVSS